MVAHFFSSVTALLMLFTQNGHSMPQEMVERVEYSPPYQPTRHQLIHHKHLNPKDYNRRHHFLIDHIPKVQLAFSGTQHQDYVKVPVMMKKSAIAKSVLMKSALLIGMGTAVKRYRDAFKAYWISTGSMNSLATTSTLRSTTSSTMVESTTASSTSISSTTAAPSTTTSSTSSSSITTPYTTTSSTSSTSSSTTATPPTTTAPIIIPCSTTESVTATQGQSGTFEFGITASGQRKNCLTVVAPAGSRVQVTCSQVYLVGGGSDKNHYLRLYDGSTFNALIVDPPMVGVAYTSTINAVSFESYVTASDSYSCTWTVV